MPEERITDQHMRAVQSGTNPVDNKSAEVARMRQTGPAPAAAGEEQPVEGATPEGQQAESPEGEQQIVQEGEQQQQQPAQEGGPTPTEPQEGQQASPEEDAADRFAKAIIDRLETKREAETQTAKGAQDISFEQQIQQQQEEVQKEYETQIATIEEQKNNLLQQVETGDMDVSRAMSEIEKLNNSKSSVERTMDRQITQLDNQLERHRDQIKNEMKQHRQAYAQNDPGFQQRYQSGQIQQALRDPQTKNVFGDNPAAVNEFLKARELQQENNQLKEQLQQLQQQQQTAVKQEATNPNQKVGSSSGVNQPKQPTAGQSGDGMLNALEQVRQSQQTAR